MAKIVSDNLILKLSHKGTEKIIDLARLFNENPNRVVSVVGSINEDGSPNTAPISLFYCPNKKIIYMGMVTDSTTIQNIKRDGRIIIETIYAGDISFGISAKATVIKEPLESNSKTAAVRVDVQSVKRDTSPAQMILGGIKTMPRTDRAAEYEKMVLKEIVEIANSGPAIGEAASAADKR